MSRPETCKLILGRGNTMYKRLALAQATAKGSEKNATVINMINVLGGLINTKRMNSCNITHDTNF